MKELTSEEKAKKLIYDFEEIVGINGSLSLIEAKKCAILCVDTMIEDARDSFKMVRENGFHGHAEGLVAGTLVTLYDLKTNIEKFGSIGKTN